MKIIDKIKKFFYTIFNNNSNNLLESGQDNNNEINTNHSNSDNNNTYKDSLNVANSSSTWKDPDIKSFPTVIYKDMDISYALIYFLNSPVLTEKNFYYAGDNKYVLRSNLSVEETYNILYKITYLATSSIGEIVIDTDKSSEFINKIGRNVYSKYNLASTLYDRADNNGQKEKAVEILENLLRDTTNFKEELYKEDEIEK